MHRNIYRKITYEDRFDRNYACWANNHKGWSKYKRENRKRAREKLRDLTRKETGEYYEEL